VFGKDSGEHIFCTREILSLETIRVMKIQHTKSVDLILNLLTKTDL